MWPGRGGGRACSPRTPPPGRRGGTNPARRLRYFLLCIYNIYHTCKKKSESWQLYAGGRGKKPRKLPNCQCSIRERCALIIFATDSFEAFLIYTYIEHLYIFICPFNFLHLSFFLSMPFYLHFFSSTFLSRYFCSFSIRRKRRR